ncbi:hypothetical protein RI129_003154 [Pyrocoelia pectoralis]|uniref:DDE Tnp4 domain-containing protein n=1 Tax=Pyrocoelia pectoralis TaxID=417401 RepID=A0AAN7ZMT2_9COLE
MDNLSSTSSSSMSDMELSSDDDFDLFEERDRPKNQNYFQETIPSYNDEEFCEHFHISRRVAESIALQFEQSEYFHYQSGGNGKLSSLQHVLIYLWFVAHQTASFRDVADRFHISISSLFVIIRKLTNFLSNLSHRVISWPSPEEQTVIERHFRDNDFPGVIGAIDGSHVKIDKPSNDPDSYLNRKHFFSIQLQAVCDHRKKIRDLFVGFPGSVHDSRVFRTSALFNTLPEKCHNNTYILGDSGYPCLPNLLTPFKDRGDLTRRQSNFNLKLSKNRYVIEHCFGLLKQKFRQLYHVKLRSIVDIVHLIRACCVLHNLALDDHFQYEEVEDVVQHDNEVVAREFDEEEVERDDGNGIQRRNQVANLLRF